MIQIISLIVSLVICLFILFLLAKNDFVLVRKNISLKQVFDSVFISFLGFLLVGRLWFVMLNKQFYLFSPIRFVHIVRFPGIGLVGGLIGFYIAAYIYFRKKKTIARVFDIFSLSLMPLILYMLLFLPFSFYQFWIKLGITVLFVFLFCLFLYFHKHYTVKDGTITIFLSLIISLLNMVFIGVNNLLILHKNNIPVELILPLSIFALTIVLSFIYRKRKT